MAQRPVREYTAKKMMANNWADYFKSSITYHARFAGVSPETDLNLLAKEEEWLKHDRLVAKPDMIIGKRGKLGLVLLDQDWPAVKQWLEEKRNQEISVGSTKGVLTHFLIEPYVPSDQEYYISISSNKDGNEILFSDAGGVDIEDQIKKDAITSIQVSALEDIAAVDLESKLSKQINGELKPKLSEFIRSLYKYYLDLHYAFLEINPFVLRGDKFIPLDLKCRLDDAADFEAAKKWGHFSYPAEFGASLSSEEEFIKKIDGKSGASLKLTILNPKGKIWTMVAGGGASVIFTDTIADMGYAKEIANYGEYSGNPSTDETYQYAKTILDLMTREKTSNGEAKYLLIGGGIANFTDVSNTFTGIIQALNDYKEQLINTPVKIYVRRGGPNYLKGLKMMKKLGEDLGVPIEVFGPETHMTEIVRLALNDSKS